MRDSRQTVSVFLSSPGDVDEERRAAREVIEALGAGHLLRDKVRFDIVSSDDDDAAAPMDARDTPQASVNRYAGRPADCDLTLVILWSRLGTPLPSEIVRADGSRYPSGTVWEYEDALAAKKSVFVYRRTVKPQIDIDAQDYEGRRAQYEHVKQFFAGFTNPDGSLKAGFTAYADPAQFRTLLRQHLEAFVNERLAGRVVPTLPAIGPDDPRVTQILTLIDELARKNRQLDEQNAEIARLARENQELRRAAIARTLTAAAQPGAKDAATAAAEALHAGDTGPAEDYLGGEERADAAHIGRSGADAAALRREAAARAREQAALATGRDVQAALAAYQRAAEYDPDDAWTHFLIGDLQIAVGSVDAARRSYERGAAAAKTRLESTPSDVDARRDLSVSHDRTGDVLMAQGNSPGALAAYREALAIREALAAREPDNTDCQRDLSVSRNKIGNVLVAQGDGAGALAAYREGLAIREALAARDPVNAEWQRDVSVSHNRIGDLLVAQGDRPGALAAYRQSLAIAEALAARDPGNTEWQRDVSINHERFGEALMAEGDRLAALAAYRKGLAIAETLAARDPDNTQWQRDLSASHERIGDVLAAQGDSPGALEAYRRTLAIVAALAASDPANAQWQSDLADSHNNIGNVLNAAGDGRGALAAYRNALAIREALAARDPANARWAVDLALSCGKLGSLTHELGAAERRSFLTRGRAILERLKTTGQLLPGYDRIGWFDEQILRVTEDDGRTPIAVADSDRT